MQPLRWLLLLGLALAGTSGACIVVDSMLAVDCIEHVRQDVPFATPNDDAALQFKLDRCRLDHDACAEVCTLALERSGIGDPASACQVEFGATQAIVHVTFDRQTGAPGCLPQGLSMGSGIADAQIFPPNNFDF